MAAASGGVLTFEVDVSSPLIVGFGVVGRAVAEVLRARGVTATVIEDRPTDDVRARAAELGSVLLESPSGPALDAAVSAASVILPSPGIPDHHPVFARAAVLDRPIRSEFDLARQWDDRPIAAITGTNGKTSVTMMVTDALNRSGHRAAAVGNTDVPLVAALADSTIETFVVEASSFRLGHSNHFTPTVATWLNMAPDHLDAHASYEAYVAAKAVIWASLPPGATAVANADDPTVMAHLPQNANVECFSMVDTSAAWHLDGDRLVGPDGPFSTLDALKRRQPHDVANALAVAATACAAGADLGAVTEVVTSFSGLPHRLEHLGTWDDVAWYDDSKATVPQATAVAVGGFESVVLIAGGRNKGLDLGALRDTVPPVHHVIATGDAADEVAATFDSLAPVDRAASMAEAVDLAAAAARPGDAVLLSPGCTSFDWYANYVERGCDFARLVRGLAVDR